MIADFILGMYATTVVVLLFFLFTVIIFFLCLSLDIEFRIIYVFLFLGIIILGGFIAMLIM